MQTVISNFLKEVLNIEPESLNVGEAIDVSDKNIGLLSYNESENKKEYKRVLKLVRKEDSIIYLIKTDEAVIEVSKDHKIFIRHSMEKIPFYATIEDIYRNKNRFLCLNDKDKWIPFSIEKTKRVDKIYDFQIEDNRNYYSNGILSHNTMWGSPETTQGGNALRFYAHMRMDISRSLTTDNSVIVDDEKVANLHKVHIKKNKMAAPFKKAEFYIEYGRGIDKIKEVIDLGHETEVIKKRGDTIKYGEDKFTVEEFTNLLKDNEDFFNEIRNKILAQSKVKNLNNTFESKEEIIEQIETLTNELIEEDDESKN